MAYRSSSPRPLHAREAAADWSPVAPWSSVRKSGDGQGVAAAALPSASGAVFIILFQLLMLGLLVQAL